MKKKKLTRYIIIGVVGLIIILIIGKKAGWFGKSELQKVAVEKPADRRIVEYVSANGKIQPVTEVKISSDVSGEIVELPVKEGQRVNRGDLLFKVKPDVYLSQRDRANAALNSAKTRISQAQVQLQKDEQAYRRNKTLYDQKVISKAEFEAFEAAYNSSKNSLQAAQYDYQSAQASLKETNESLSKTTVYAPMDGIVSKLNVELGERVVGTMQMAGTEVMRIANLNQMEVYADVNENDIVKVKLNDTALVEIDAYLGQKFKGIVTQIANSATSSATSTDQVINFEVRVLLLQDSYKSIIRPGMASPFRPGMSASVEIQTNSINKALTIPIQAVTNYIDTTKKIAKVDKAKKSEEKSDEEVKPVDEDSVLDRAGGEEVVYVYNSKEKNVKRVKVKTGIQDNTYIQILSGLTKKDQVVVAPFSAISRKLKDGAKVEVVPPDKVFE